MDRHARTGRYYFRRLCKNLTLFTAFARTDGMNRRGDSKYARSEARKKGMGATSWKLGSTLRSTHTFKPVCGARFALCRLETAPNIARAFCAYPGSPEELHRRQGGRQGRMVPLFPENA